MWWSPLAGFLVSMAGTGIWGSRGAVVSLATGVVAGMAFAFFEALVVTHPSMSETYTQSASFAVLVGIYWSLTWGMGACLGIPAGFALRRIKLTRMSN